MSHRKKLIEVSLPLDAINAASAREKSIRHGHPSTLHLWWARRPLAACRAVLFAQLVDDPSSCTEEFPTVEEQDRERDRLHGIIEAMVPWEASTNETILHAARYEIARSVARNGGPALPPEWKSQAHAAKVIDYLQQHAPPVHDPFSGGGSIPLEAQRLGLRARGSDLNPVAVLIGKALVEFPPKFAGMAPVNPDADRHKSWKGAEGLADDVRYYGRWMRHEAQKQIGHLYPKARLPGGGEATVIAWLWARTVPSPDPRANGAQVPLASSFVVSARKGKEVIVVPVVDREAMTWRFEAKAHPTPEEVAAAKNGTKTGRGANFTCILTGAVIDGGHVKAEAMGGRMSERLMAVVAEGDRGRVYLSPTDQHQEVALDLEKPEVPEIAQPLADDPRNFWTVSYGLDSFDKLFTSRQLTALTTFSDLVDEARKVILADAETRWRDPASASDKGGIGIGGIGPAAYADAVATYLAFALGKLANLGSAVTGWMSDRGAFRETFARQAIPMAWDFAEANSLSEAGGSFSTVIEKIAMAVEAAPTQSSGQIENRDAAKNGFPDGAVFSTDPPYYDNIAYADLSDYFYVHLKRALGSVHPEIFRRVLTPKNEELVATPYRHGGKMGAEEFFMVGMSRALSNIARTTGGVPAAIYYAFKQAESGADGVTSAGWSTFLQAVTDSGLAVDGTWPIRTESPGRMIGRDTNALASSIVLVCRRRDAGAEAINKTDFLRRLRTEMPTALATIRAAGVGPTDIQQAAIGPGIGIFTRHSAVLNPDGSEMSVREALKLINQVREELASEAQGDYDPPTRFAIDWFFVHGHRSSRSGEAITMANAIGLGLADLERAGIFKTGEGRAELMERGNLRADWSPRTDRFPTAWEACQHLIRRLEAADGGIDAAAALFAELGDLAEPAHQLAFRLYDICNNKGWAAEAQPYNNLIQEWPVIEERSRAFVAPPPAQGEMAI